MDAMKDINISGLLIKRIAASDSYVARGILNCGYAVTVTVDVRQHIRHDLRQEVMNVCGDCIKMYGGCHEGVNCHE